MGKLYWEKHFQEPLYTFKIHPTYRRFILFFLACQSQFSWGVGWEKIDTFNLKELKQELNLKKVSREGLKLKSYLWNSKHSFNKTIYNIVIYIKNAGNPQI